LQPPQTERLALARDDNYKKYLPSFSKNKQIVSIPMKIRNVKTSSFGACKLVVTAAKAIITDGFQLILKSVTIGIDPPQRINTVSS